ncbi:MAG TPA: response regulator [Holophagaceae bacterium]
MIRIVVVEDEPLARQHLVELLGELPGVAVVASAENGRLGLAAITEHRPDAVFLDIEMPGIKGTELMHMLPEPRPALVFVTAYPQHAIEAFAGGAVHYLLKPISRVGVAQALSRIRPKDEPLQKEWLRIPVRKKGTTRLLRPEEVEALVADLGDCVAWTPEGRLPVDGTLAHWEERLSEHGFMRVHRNALVRLDAVREMTAEDELVLATGRLPISRRRVEEVRRSLGL